eukprot:TRINITY_DN52_c0_g1_i3.p1 TRINITY_DN52_c0_g1~~TRINITY_DN52_c0_g1_i3.p1  ORF type:complete len:152 (+),score=30.14 TRINITY_DN52_c0_g1_i3:177-632(+)
MCIRDSINAEYMGSFVDLLNDSFMIGMSEFTFNKDHTSLFFKKYSEEEGKEEKQELKEAKYFLIGRSPSKAAENVKKITKSPDIQEIPIKNGDNTISRTHCLIKSEYGKCSILGVSDSNPSFVGLGEESIPITSDTSIYLSENLEIRLTFS